MIDVTELLIRIETLEVRDARRELDKLGKQSGKTERSTKDLDKSWVAARASALGMAAGAAAVGAAMVGVNKAFERAKAVQKFEAQLKTATGSVVAAGFAFEQLRDFASQTPFALEQSIEAFIKLKNLGLDPSQEAMKSYGNTASAMGKELSQLIEAVADATTFEFERLKEFGIKTKQEGDRVIFTFRGVTTEVAKDSAAIEGYLQGIGQTQFAGAMAEQMDTINGAVSNLGDTYDALFDKFNERGFEDALGEGIDMVADGLENITQWVDRGGADGIIEDFQLFANTLRTVKEAADPIIDVLNKISNNPLYKYMPGRIGITALTGAAESANAGQGKGRTAGAAKAAKDWLKMVEDEAKAQAVVNDKLMVYHDVLGEVEADRAEASDRAMQREEREAKQADEIAAKQRARDEEAAKKEKERAAKRAEMDALRTTQGAQRQFDGSPNAQQLSIMLGLGSEEDKINDRFLRDRELIMENTRITGEQRLALEVELAERRHAELNALNKDQNAMLLTSASQTFDGLAGLALAAGGKTSAAYKTLFGISKGFAIADATIKTQQAVAQALSLPFPANIAMMGQAAAQGGRIISSISSIQGAFEHGGMINAGNYGIVGESGAEIVKGPAVVTSARTTAGKATASGGSGGMTVNIHNSVSDVAEVQATQSADGKTVQIAVTRAKSEIHDEIQRGYGIGRAIQDNFNTERR